MMLSERAAIRSVIADGGFKLYPAGRILDEIIKGLPQDTLKGDFDPVATVQKIKSVSGPDDPCLKKIFDEDKALLCERLEDIRPEYNMQTVFEKMAAKLPQLAKRYYSVENFEPVAPQIVEFFFEGHSDLYKNADWFAFNVSKAESVELKVPVGMYFKRDQVSPGQTEFALIHEANHAMQELCALPPGVHYYVPWLDEGLADMFGRMMLYAITEDEKLIRKIKTFKTEVEVTDNRKTTYHYGEETVALLLMRGRLPLVKALLSARKDSPYDFDWSELANSIKSGIDPHIGIINAYKGLKKETFQKRLAKNEMHFRKETDLNQGDLKVLTMFMADQPPAVLPAKEYLAACYLLECMNREPSPYHIDPAAIPEGLRQKITDWKEDALLPFSSIPADVLNKVPGLFTRKIICASDIPDEFKEGVEALSQKYFVIKREIGGVTVYEPYGGGLPIRLQSGEIRCSW